MSRQRVAKSAIDKEHNCTLCGVANELLLFKETCPYPFVGSVVTVQQVYEKIKKNTCFTDSIAKISSKLLFQTRRFSAFGRKILVGVAFIERLALSLAC